jgi:hypothetical protein
MQFPYGSNLRGLLAMMDAEDEPRGLLAFLGYGGDARSVDGRIDLSAAARRAGSDAFLDPMFVADHRPRPPAVGPSNPGGLGLAQMPTDDLLRQILPYLPPDLMPPPAQAAGPCSCRKPSTEAGRPRFQFPKRPAGLDRGLSILEYVPDILWRLAPNRANDRIERPAVVTGPRG